VGKFKVTKTEARRHLPDRGKVQVMIAGPDNYAVCLFRKVA
jgi:hypothetical protein